jgi:esterase/lipase
VVSDINLKADSDKEFFLIHGYTGSPTDFNELPMILHKEFNANVKVMLLKGHGTDIQNLDNMTYKQLLDKVESEFQKSLKTKRKIVLGGICLGAQMAFYLASKYHVEGLFHACMPYRLSFPFNIKGLKYLGIFRKYWRKRMSENEKKLRQGTFHYKYMHVNGLEMVKESNKYIPDILKRVTCPVLTVHSKRDPLSSYKAMEEIEAHLGSRIKTTALLNNNNHNLFFSDERQKAYSSIVKFFKDRF